jgi:hypothetical protein
MRNAFWMLAGVATLAAIAAPARQAAAAREEGSKACFAKLKSLSGDWYTTDEKTGKETLALRIRVIAAGSAVEELEMPGTSEEMVTIYHLDGPGLVMTHYCALGNQPHLKATAASTPDKIVFDCDSVGNAKSHNDMHMHHLTIVTKDASHLESEWQAAQDGKPGMTAKFKVHRKGSK